MPDHCYRCGEGEARICVSCAAELSHDAGEATSPAIIVRLPSLPSLELEALARALVHIASARDVLREQGVDVQVSLTVGDGEGYHAAPSPTAAD